MSTLTVKARKPLEQFEKNNLLNNMVVDKDSIVYTLISGDFEQLKTLSGVAKEIQNVK